MCVCQRVCIKARLVAVLLLVAVSGCGAPVLSVDDAVAKQGRPVTFSAYVGRRQMFGLRTSVQHAPVSFFLEGKQISQTQTNQHGRAVATIGLGALHPSRFQVRTVVGGQEVHAPGRIFWWDEERVVIAVDIDNTISATDYDRLILWKKPTGSPPIPGALETLTQLAEHYNIMYLTGRPHFLLEKTRAWLDEYKFPPAPIVMAPTLPKAARPTKFKRKTLAAWRDQWPNLLIGIGNREGDTEAYAPNHMLPLIVLSEAETKHYVSDVVFTDWNAAREFFTANKQTLTDPKNLAEVIQGKILLPQPLIPWDAEKAFTRKGLLSPAPP